MSGSGGNGLVLCVRADARTCVFTNIDIAYAISRMFQGWWQVQPTVLDLDTLFSGMLNDAT